MVNHPNRKVICRHELDGMKFPVSHKFKKGSLLSNTSDFGTVAVYVDFLDSTVYLTNKYQIGSSMDEFNGDAVSCSLRDLDPASTLESSHSPDEEICLGNARLIQQYLDSVDIVTEETKQVVWGVIGYGFDREDYSPEELTRLSHKAFWKAISTMKGAMK